MSPPRRANLHLHILGRDLVASFAMPEAPVPAQAMLSAALAITDAVVAVAAEASADAGRAVSCRRGCAACCRQMVMLAPVEALGVADWVAGLPAERQGVVRGRFGAAIARVREAGLIEAASPDGDPVFRAPASRNSQEAYLSLLDAYFGLYLACPFLEDESCSAYAGRPTQCREYVITSPPENCREVGTELTVGVELPLYMSDALVGYGVKEEGARRKVPLIFALAWAETHRGDVQEEGDPKELLVALMKLIDTEAVTPFESRAAG